MSTMTLPRTTVPDERRVFGHTMGLVGVASAFAALGGYLGRDLTGGATLVAFLVALGALFGLRAAVTRSEQLAVGLLCTVGLALGVALAPVLATYLTTDPAAVAQAAGATALFVGGLGAYGYATSRDVTAWARPLLWALIGLLAFGLLALFVAIPAANVIYPLAGLAIFGGLTVVDFNRLRRAGTAEPVLLAAGIFLDVVNVFQLFLMLFGGGGFRRR